MLKLKEYVASLSTKFSSYNYDNLKINLNSSRHIKFFYPGFTSYTEYLL